jgi:hypothetical protein
VRPDNSSPGSQSTEQGRSSRQDRHQPQTFLATCSFVLKDSGIQLLLEEMSIGVVDFAKGDTDPLRVCQFLSF